jgi:hypothetical protein
MKNKIVAIWYWFAYRFLSRWKFHLVNTKLKPQYYDIDHRLTYACFALLEEFIEEEKPVSWWCEGEDPRIYKNCLFLLMNEPCLANHRHDLAILLDLYDWWQWRKNYDPYDFYEIREVMECFDEDQELENWDTEQLQLLMRLRGHMWT